MKCQGRLLSHEGGERGLCLTAVEMTPRLLSVFQLCTPSLSLMLFAQSDEANMSWSAVLRN